MNLAFSSNFPNIGRHEANSAMDLYSPMIVADEMRIQQILLNLQINALKFTERGSVDIVVEIEKKDNETFLKV